MSARYRIKFLTLGLLVLLGVSSQLHATQLISGQLSERVTISSSSRVVTYRLTPDGTRVIYRAIDVPTDTEAYQLYSVNVDGSEPRRLTTSAPEDSVQGFEISADSQTVVYSTFGRLYSLSLDGGSPIPLDTPPTIRAGGFIISGDSQYVAFSDFEEVYSVPIGGGPITLLSDTNYPMQRAANSFRIDPNSEYVLFDRTESFDGGTSTRHILSTPIAGGDLNELLPVDDGLQDVFFNQLDPTGERLVYLSSRNEQQLFSVPIDSGTRSALSAVYDFNSFLQVFISPDGQNIIYTAISSMESVADQTFLVPVIGGVPIQIDSGLAGGLKSCGVSFTPDSSQFVLCRGASSQSGGLVYLASVEAPLSRTMLNQGETLVGFGNSPRYSEDMRELLLATITPAVDEFDHQLIRLPLNGGEQREVFKFRSSSSSSLCLDEIDFTPNNAMFSDCQVGSGLDDIRLVVQRTGGSAAIKLDSNDPDNAESIIFQAITSDGLYVVYLKHFANEGVSRLFSASTTPDGELCVPIKVDSSITVVCL